MITANAKAAKGCLSQEATNSPFINKAIALPKPHPGHRFTPIFSRIHRLKWFP